MGNPIHISTHYAELVQSLPPRHRNSPTNHSSRVQRPSVAEYSCADATVTATLLGVTEVALPEAR